MSSLGLKISRTVTLATLLPLLIGVVSAGQYSQFRCLMTGMVSESPCCPGVGPAAGAERASLARDTLAAEDCCSREDVEVARPIATQPAPGADSLGAPIALVTSVPLTPFVPAPLTARSAAFHPPQPPLLLMKRSLLI